MRQGWRFDPDCARATHRLRRALGILANMGVVPTIAHGKRCDEDAASIHGRQGCWDDCKTIWPEWAEDRLFDAAYELADAYQTLHGGYQRSRIGRQ